MLAMSALTVLELMHNVCTEGRDTVKLECISMRRIAECPEEWRLSLYRLSSTMICYSTRRSGQRPDIG
jgi:hypothetical protein